MKYFWIWWGVVIGVVGCSSVNTMVKRGVTATPSEAAVWTPNFRSESEKNSYRLLLQTPKNSISGICVLKKIDGEWRGAVINEMGAKAFDFIVTDDKCELLNVVSMMDKGVVKKIIAADLFFLFNTDNPKASFYNGLERFEQDGKLIINYKKKQVTVGQGSPVILVNNRHNIRYELKKIFEINPNKLIE